MCLALLEFFSSVRLHCFSMHKLKKCTTLTKRSLLGVVAGSARLDFAVDLIFEMLVVDVVIYISKQKINPQVQRRILAANKVAMKHRSFLSLFFSFFFFFLTAFARRLCFMLESHPEQRTSIQRGFRILQNTPHAYTYRYEYMNTCFAPNTGKLITTRVFRSSPHYSKETEEIHSTAVPLNRFL